MRKIWRSLTDIDGFERKLKIGMERRGKEEIDEKEECICVRIKYSICVDF